MQAGYLLEGFNQNIVGLHWDVLPLNSLINVLILNRGGGKGAESHINHHWSSTQCTYLLPQEQPVTVDVVHDLIDISLHKVHEAASLGGMSGRSHTRRII